MQTRASPVSTHLLRSRQPDKPYAKTLGSTRSSEMSAGDDEWFPEYAPSYDRYRMSSEDEEEEQEDDVPLLDNEEQVVHQLRYPSESNNLLLGALNLVPMPRMSGSLKELNRKAIEIYEESRECINLIYHSDLYLKDSSYLSSVLELKYESFNQLRGLRHKFQPVLEGISRLGGPLIAPPRILWTYLYFFWFDEDACGGTVPTPVPQYEVPDFVTRSLGP